jgi:hypothetical protein
MKETREKKSVVPLKTKGAMRNKHRAVGVGKVRASHQKQSNIITKQGGQKMEAKTGFTGFDINNVSENYAKFIKYSLDTTFENVAKVQEFNEKIVRDTIEAGKKAQVEAEKLVNESIEAGKKGWSEYRKAVTNGFKKVEEMIQPVK